jgi:hypothetical protein
MVSGMEMATRLYRLIYGTWEAAVMMGQKLSRNSALAEDCSTKVLQFILLLKSGEAGRSITERRMHP